MSYRIIIVIRSFKDRDTQNLFENARSRKFPKAVCKIGIRKLDYLNATVKLEDLKASPANRLKELTGKDKGKYSIRINDQYRLVFKFKEGDAFEVEITDYH